MSDFCSSTVSSTAVVAASRESKKQARRLVLVGRVQGFGIRPTVYRLATRLHLTGTVQNTSRGVVVEIEGTAQAIDQFVDSLPNEMPAGAQLDAIESEEAPPGHHTAFTIVREPSGGPLWAQVPPDRAVCPECLAEVADDADRRAAYPFTSCTQCGPRYSIIDSMPYERQDTTMGRFAFCDACRAEYGGADDRRFHAQTNACDLCGPQVWCVDHQGHTVARRADAVQLAADALRDGKIVALRAVGGYQLLLDATNEQAVRRLRDRKRRPAKPLAVLVESLAAARRLAEIDPVEELALASAANPIVLVKSRSGSPLSPGVHPGLDCVGLLLPTTPLHWLVARAAACPLVCTSGNRDGEPLAYRIDEAERDLRDVSDLWIHHDRPITRPIDDSVVRVIAGRPVTIRLARGLAPLVLDLPATEPCLAVGGHLKAAVAWCNGAQAVLGPHVGDLQSVATRERYVEQIAATESLYRFAPAAMAHDLHPEYFSTTWAVGRDGPLCGVQHHHAHIVAGMLENGWLDRRVLGVSWDGTGYGTDGTIWGGEFLVCTARHFERIAALRSFRLPGGEAAVYQPWRVAVAMLQDSVHQGLLDKSDVDRLPLADISAQQRRQIAQIADRSQFSPQTTSAGRLFDAAAVIALGITRAQFDGQPAMLLEAAADRRASGRYQLPLLPGTPATLDWRPLIAQMLRDRAADTPAGVMAMRFHRAVARGIADVCRSRPDLPVVLGGGVFQNRLLTELVVDEFSTSGQPLGLPGVIPPGDGGLAAGQLASLLAPREDE